MPPPIIPPLFIIPPIIPAAERHLVTLGRSQIGLGHGVGGETQRRVERMRAQRRLVAVDQVKHAVFEAAIERVGHREPPARLAIHIEHEIGPHGRSEDDPAAGRLMRLDRLAIERHDRRPMVLELQPEDPRIGSIDQTEAQSLAGAHREALQDAPVDRDRVADPAIVAAVHEAAEVVADLGVWQQTPVVQHPRDVPVDLDRLALLDDQRPIQAAPDLLEAALVRVVPVSPGVGDVELVDEGLARRDRTLGQVRHAVHGVRHP
jgi:hypothetical protein